MSKTLEEQKLLLESKLIGIGMRSIDAAARIKDIEVVMGETGISFDEADHICMDTTPGWAGKADFKIGWDICLKYARLAKDRDWKLKHPETAKLEVTLGQAPFTYMQTMVNVMNAGELVVNGLNVEIGSNSGQEAYLVLRIPISKDILIKAEGANEYKN